MLQIQQLGGREYNEELAVWNTVAHKNEILYTGRDGTVHRCMIYTNPESGEMYYYGRPHSPVGLMDIFTKLSFTRPIEIDKLKGWLQAGYSQLDSLIDYLVLQETLSLRHDLFSVCILENQAESADDTDTQPIDHNLGTIRREWKNVSIVIDGVTHSLIDSSLVNDEIYEHLPAFVEMVKLTKSYQYVTDTALLRSIESMIADKTVYVDSGRLDELRYLAKLIDCTDVIEGKIKELLSKDKYVWSIDEDGTVFVGDEEVFAIDVDTSSFVRLLLISEDTYLLSLKVESLDGTPSTHDEAFYSSGYTYEQLFKLTCTVGNWDLEQLV